jgi:alpha-N-arabinofuranosidase
MANRIRCKAEAWEEYKKRFPALNDGKVKVSLDEWHQGGGGLEQALIIGLSFHEMFRHTDFLTMAAFTMGTTWLDYSRTKATYSAIGLAFNLYNKHFGKIPVEVTGNAPMPPPKYPVGGDQPRVNAGSPTYPLDVSAALKDGGKTLTVAIVNATDTAQHMDLALAGFKPKSKGRMWRLTGASLQAANTVGLPPGVTVKDASFDALAKFLSVAPYSIELYELAAA